MADTNPIDVAKRILKRLAVEEIAGELMKLEEIVSKIPGVLDDAAIRAGRNNPKVRDWLEELEDALFDAEEILEEAPGKKTDPKLLGVRKQLEKLVGKKPKFNADGPREGDEEALINLLLGSGIDETVSVISIFGFKGIGKTRLARLIFDHARVKTSFQLRLWVGVSELEFSSIRPADEIIKFKTGRGIENPESELEKFVEGKILLLVLDDVQSQKIDPNKWLGFKRLLMGAAEGSRVLITTRSREVASMTATVAPYEVKLLRAEMASEDSEKHSGKFGEVKHSGEFGEVKPSGEFGEVKPSGEFDEVKPSGESGEVKHSGECDEVKHSGESDEVKHSGESDEVKHSGESDEVKHSGESDEVKHSGESDEVKHSGESDEVKHSGDLTKDLKNCIAYCSLFPKDHEFDESTLSKIWVAQGFTGEGSYPDSSKDLDILYQKGFFKKVETEDSTTQSKWKIVDDMHDLAMSGGGNRCIKLDSVYQITSERKKTQSAQHVSFDFPLSSLRRIPASLKSTKGIESLLIFPYQQSGKCKDGSNQAICDAIVSNFKSLRTLDLHYSGIKTVPPKIGSLGELRYLDLSKNTKLKVLPNSITKLQKLQTLKLSWCFGLKELPRDIKNLVELRHLEIDGCYNLTRMPSGLGELRDLQTLSQFVLSISGNSEELRELGKLNKLGGDLQIRNLRPGQDVRDMGLGEKQDLRSLTLDWVADAVGWENETILEDGLGEHQNLQRLAFSGYGGVNLPNWLSKSQNLKKLELRRCSKCEFLPPLHNCPSLETLVLDDMTKLEYIAKDHVVEDSFFPSLKELRLTELRMLKRWWKITSPEVNHEVPVFTKLSKLSIEDCPELISMPLFPNLVDGLVLDSTSWKPFEQTMNMADLASSSSSPSVSLSLLKNLSFVGIENLNDIAANAIKWEALKSLQFLRLDYLPDLKSLPDGLQSITSLQELNIWRCNFTHIPDWIGELISLKKLRIWVCPEMKSLPEKISSLKLLTLEIEECPRLLQRCLRNAGADWDKISRIPELLLGRMSKQ